jgi:hypothetical protein
LAEDEAKKALGGPSGGDIFGDVQHECLLELEVFGVDLGKRGVCGYRVISKALWETG